MTKQEKINEELAIKAVDDFKARLVKYMPSIVVSMEGEELECAIKMVKAYKELILSMEPL